MANNDEITWVFRPYSLNADDWHASRWVRCGWHVWRSSSGMNSYPEFATNLSQRIAGITVAMMTTIDQHGNMHSRPMKTQQITDEVDLWFFVSSTTSVADNLRHNSAVNLSYVDSVAHRYVSVVGHGRLRNDSERIRRFWDPEFQAWFPNGINDPSLALIQVNVTEADYWDGSEGTFVRISGFIRQLLGDEPQNHVKKGHLDLGAGAH